MNTTCDIKVYWGNTNWSFSVKLYLIVLYVLHMYILYYSVVFIQYSLYFESEELNKAGEFLLPQEY